MKELIRAEGLGKELRQFSLKDITFSLEPGYIMGLIGVNGAGKTTLTNELTGLVYRTVLWVVFLAVNCICLKKLWNPLMERALSYEAAYAGAERL